ncbi:MAG: hypothetical protein MI922_00525 [Bacteroidales bacterium]|nr:hypothetical protein [Bacteroidales bacterium]
MLKQIKNANVNATSTVKQLSRAVANSIAPTTNNSEHIIGFKDNRPESVIQRKIRDAINLELTSNRHDSKIGHTCQRSVNIMQMKVFKYNKGWITDYDPYSWFKTKKEALNHQKKLISLGNTKRYKIRVPTAYTYTHKKVHNKMTSIPQGPHTYSHKGIIVPLQNVKTKKDLKKIFDEQPLSPSSFDTVLSNEAPPKGYNKMMTGRINRLQTDYKKIYDNTENMFNQPNFDMIEQCHNVNKLLNLDPFQTYGWKSNNKVSKKSLSGKGEGKPNPSFDDLFDEPKSNYFKDQGEYKFFKDTRKDMFDENF